MRCAFDAEHRHAGTRRDGALAPRSRDADVVQHAIVTAHDYERLVSHDAGPFQHTVEEARIAGACASSENAEQKEKSQKYARGEQSSRCHSQRLRSDADPWRGLYGSASHTSMSRTL